MVSACISVVWKGLRDYHQLDLQSYVHRQNTRNIHRHVQGIFHTLKAGQY